MGLTEDVRDIARRAGVDLFVLFGSRARGEARSDSDWDFAYAFSGDRSCFDPEALQADLVRALGSDRIDLVDLKHGSALLRFRIAAEGSPIYQAEPGAFEDFQIEAARFWCDVNPVLEASYRDVLARLGAA
ncbi:MAG TPA: nucleotidyltransferase domain-containing protein [Polyangia bacterium]|nr:nucleotidyltransferase domain-containing protein [Polyangia bacterium]